MYWNGIGSGSEGIWVDKLSRKLFPLIYTLFNLLYWIICCTSGHIPYPENVIRHPIELIEGWRSFFIILWVVFKMVFLCFINLWPKYCLFMPCPVYILPYRHTVVEKIKYSVHIQCMLFIFKHPLNKNGTRLGTMFLNDHLSQNKLRRFWISSYKKSIIKRILRKYMVRKNIRTLKV